MHLIVIVAALLIERTLGQLRRWRDSSAFATYVSVIETRAFGRRWLAGPLAVLVIVPPVAVTAIIQWAMAHYLWLGLQLLFALFVLLISLGPRDLWEDVYALAHARTQADHDQVEARAVAMCRRATGRPAARIDSHTVLGSVLVQGHERVLAVLLWFFVAGPAGALFYRLVRELPSLAARDCASRASQRTAEYVHGVAAWLPARIAALIYALVGRTRTALSAWPSSRSLVRASGGASWRLLAQVGRGALGISLQTPSAALDETLNATLLQALSLISRSVLVLLALFAVLTILGVLR